MIDEITRTLESMDIVHERQGDLVVASFDSEIPAYHLPVAMDITVSGRYLVTRAFLIGDIDPAALGVVTRYALEASGQLVGAKLVYQGNAILVQAEGPAGLDPSGAVLDLLRRTLAATRVVLLEVITLATDPWARDLVGRVQADQPGGPTEPARPARDLVSLVPRSVNSSERLAPQAARRVAIVRLAPSGGQDDHRDR